jgi:hypothetical protein
MNIIFNIIDKTLVGAICGFIFMWVFYFIQTWNYTGVKSHNAGLMLIYYVPIFIGLGAFIGSLIGLMEGLSKKSDKLGKTENK